jgi:acyl-homoserine lactone acylase PvdQ
MTGRRGAIAGVVLAAALALAAPVAAAPAPLAYGEHDAGGFRNILPPGQNGLANGPELGSFLTSGARPAHSDDQLAPYRDLLYGYRDLDAAGVGRYFKDATFGVKPGDAERTYSPRDDVTIVRDRSGVPHIYGATRAGAMYGTGYATAEDRLFFLDVFRHIGRGQLASFAGGSPGNRAFDHLVWTVAPYTEADLQSQIDSERPGFEVEAAKLRADLAEYVAGINAYIAEARLNPLKLPAEYAAINRPQGPDDWKGTDTVATALVVGAILGVGGGGELASAQVLERARTRFGARRGLRVWKDFRALDDPTAPTTVRGRRFRYPRLTGKAKAPALPDPGSVKVPGVQVAGTGSGADPVPTAPGAPPDGDPPEKPGATKAATRGLLALPHAMSNAILVSASRSASGRPLAVFGPQTGYFAPQALMEQEVQAPGISARGVAFPGVNLYVQIGHGQGYAWSATTSAQDIVDTFAVDLCDPKGGPAKLDSAGYRDRGACTPIETLERTNAWEPNAADDTPSGTETLLTERTRLGLVVGRATIAGKPVAYTRLRSTYRHEPDSGLAFAYFNDPDRIKSPQDFQRAASLVGYAFNWFYIDARHIAYQNAGYNPRRAPGTDPDLPIRGRRGNEWRGFDPAALTLSAFTPRTQHPQFVDQAWAVDWNNKQAAGYGAADENWGYGPAYRSQLLGNRVGPLVDGARKATLPQLVTAMEDAATVDLRADAALPLALKAIGRSADAKVREATALLDAWQRDGAHRIDADRDGAYENARAVALFDAWWPRWLKAQFTPALGEPLMAAIAHVNEFANLPNNHGDHLGSAWQDGWHGYAIADLRRLLTPKRAGTWSRVYCGGGSRKRCRAALEASLKEALAADPKAAYAGDAVCAEAGRAGDQACFDSVWFRPIGGVTQPLIPWVNRPTFQQVVEVGAK